jgi:AcrR family transcriptional regulator
MPRDASQTRTRLLVEAERLFAHRGVFQTTTREIVEAAKQRNVSAVTYHFGSRLGLLAEILRLHGTPMDDERGARVGDDLDVVATRDLVASLVLPYAAAVREPRGRNYVRIVAQLTERFATWRIGDDLVPPHLFRILATLEQRVPEPDGIGRDRMVGAIVLMTSMVAERARAIDEGQPLTTDHLQFARNLTDMIVGVLEAPIGPPLSEARPVSATPARRPG